jgi:hypothetical protein
MHGGLAICGAEVTPASGRRGAAGSGWGGTSFPIAGTRGAFRGKARIANASATDKRSLAAGYWPCSSPARPWRDDAGSAPGSHGWRCRYIASVKSGIIRVDAACARASVASRHGPQRRPETPALPMRIGGTGWAGLVTYLEHPVKMAQVPTGTTLPERASVNFACRNRQRTDSGSRLVLANCWKSEEACGSVGHGRAACGIFCPAKGRRRQPVHNSNQGLIPLPPTQQARRNE